MLVPLPIRTLPHSDPFCYPRFMQSAKQSLGELVRTLSEDVCFANVQDRLPLMQKPQVRLASVDAGEVGNHKDAKARLLQY